MKNIKLIRDNINPTNMLKEVSLNWDDFYIDTERQEQLSWQSETMNINLIRGIVDDENKHNHIDPLDHSEGLLVMDYIDKYPLIKTFLDSFQVSFKCKIHRVNIVYLQPNGKVQSHSDTGSYYLNKNRLHLVLSGYYQFDVDDESQMFSAGELWWFNNKKNHSAHNLTPIPRIAVVFDVSGDIDI